MTAIVNCFCNQAARPLAITSDVDASVGPKVACDKKRLASLSLMLAAVAMPPKQNKNKPNTSQCRVRTISAPKSKIKTAKLLLYELKNNVTAIRELLSFTSVDVKNCLIDPAL